MEKQRNIDNAISQYNKAILETIQVSFDEVLVQENIERAVELIVTQNKNGGRVHFTGIGKPSYVASYAASLLSSTGTPSYFLDGTEAVHGSSGQVHNGDVVVFLSNSGETAELIATCHTIKNRGAKLISITRSHNSTIAKNCDLSIEANVKHEGGPLGKAPRASVLIELLVIQYISVLLQEKKDLSLGEYLMTHPGGSLGKSK